MIESYYTPEQLDDLKERGEQLGQERIQQSQEEWAELIAEVRAEMEKGHRPVGPGGPGDGPALDGPGQRVHRRRPRDRTLAGPPLEGARRHHRRRSTTAGTTPGASSEYIGQAMAAVKGNP